MKLTETLARFILNTIEQSEGRTNKEHIHEQISAVKEFVQCPHPQQSIEILSKLAIGDVLEPITIGILKDGGQCTALSSKDKILIYSISCYSGTINAPISTKDETEILKSISIIAVHYQGYSLNFSLDDVRAVMVINTRQGINELMTGFKLVGNIRSRM